jgi:plastocyanin
VANRAGPWVIGAGQTYSIRFDKPGVYEYVCSVDAAESVTITVE